MPRVPLWSELVEPGFDVSAAFGRPRLRVEGHLPCYDPQRVVLPGELLRGHGFLRREVVNHYVLVGRRCSEVKVARRTPGLYGLQGVGYESARGSSEKGKIMRRFGWLSITLVLAGAGLASAATFNVDSTKDSPDAKIGDGVCLSKAGGCTLRAAVEEANASSFASTINVPKGMFKLHGADEGANFGESGVLLLGGETSIVGLDQSKTAISGDGKRRLLEVGNNATVTVSGVTLTQAYVNGGDGAAILNRGNLTLSDVVLDRNRAEGDPLIPKSGRGAALFNTNGGTASLESVVAIGNLSDGKGGAFYNDEASTLTLLNTVVMGNQSLTDSGGGISNSGTLKLTISTVRGNKAIASAGGIDNIEGEARLLDVEISENRSGSEAGGVRTSGNFSAVNVTISGNVTAGKGGGLLSRKPGATSLNNATVANNSGGGIFAEEGAKLSIANSIIAANSTAKGTGLDCGGTINSSGYNLIQNQGGCSIEGLSTGNLYGIGAKLGELSPNDGPNRTQALEAESPAIDAGNPATPNGSDGACAPADQRGVKRPQAGEGAVARCDMGAFEKKTK